MWELGGGDLTECAGYPYFGVCWYTRFAFGSGVMSRSIASGVWDILHDHQRDHFPHQNSRISPFPTSSPKCLKSMILHPIYNLNAKLLCRRVSKLKRQSQHYLHKNTAGVLLLRLCYKQINFDLLPVPSFPLSDIKTRLKKRTTHYKTSYSAHSTHHSSPPNHQSSPPSATRSQSSYATRSSSHLAPSESS